MYLNIADFKLGLDTRRFSLNSPAGTLRRGVNGHITPGGEFEKRKAFQRWYLPANCYGLEVTEDGLTVFGSVAEGSLTAPSQVATTHRARTSNIATLTVASHTFAVGDTINITAFTGGNTAFNATGQTVTAVTATTVSYANTGADVATAADTLGRIVLNYTLPTGVTYQRLQHPDATADAMSSVIHSTVYNGKAFVVAEFGADGVISFYDSVMVDDLSPGQLALILADETALAEYIAGLVDATDDYSATSTGGVVTITGPAGQPFSVTSSNESSCTSVLETPSIIGEDVLTATLTITFNSGIPNNGDTATLEPSESSGLEGEAGFTERLDDTAILAFIAP